MYAKGEQGPIVGDGYGMNLRRQHLQEARKYGTPAKSRKSSSDYGQSGTKPYGNVDPITLLKMFVEKTEERRRPASGKV